MGSSIAAAHIQLQEDQEGCHGSIIVSRSHICPRGANPVKPIVHWKQ